MPSRHDLNLYKNAQGKQPLLGGSVTGLSQGLVTEFSSITAPITSLQEADNIDLVLDGVAQRRPPLVDYTSSDGGQLPGKLLGMMFDFTYQGFVYLIGCFNVGGTAAIFYLKEEEDTGNTWHSVLATRWTNTTLKSIHFSRAQNTLLVTGGDKNDSNSIGLIDLTADTWEVVNPVALEDIYTFSTASRSSSLTPVANGFSIRYDYSVVAKNEFGETAAANLAPFTAGKLREEWDDSDRIGLDWTDAKLFGIFREGDNVCLGRIDYQSPGRMIPGDSLLPNWWETNPAHAVQQPPPYSSDAGMAYDSNGDLFVAVTGRSGSDQEIVELFKVDPNNPSRVDGGYGLVASYDLGDSGGLNLDDHGPVGGIAFDSSDNLYITVSTPSDRPINSDYSGAGAVLLRVAAADRTSVQNLGQLPAGSGRIQAFTIKSGDGYVVDQLSTGISGLFRIKLSDPDSTSGNYGLVGTRPQVSTDPQISLNIQGLATHPDGEIYGVDVREQLIRINTSDISQSVDLGEIAPRNTLAVIALAFTAKVAPVAGNDIKYDVYLSQNGGIPYRLATDLRRTTFVDQGVTGGGRVDINKEAPRHNSTVYPDSEFSANVKGRVLLWVNRDHPNRIHYGGYDDNVLNFTPTTTSGYLDPSPSEDERIVNVVPYITDSTFYGIEVFTAQGSARRAKEYFLRPLETQLANGLVISGFTVDEIGTTGTYSAYSTVNYESNLYWPSGVGMKAKGPGVSAQRYLPSEDISSAVSGDFLDLSVTQLENMIGTSHRRDLYWAVPKKPAEDGYDAAYKCHGIWALKLAQRRNARERERLTRDTLSPWCWLYWDNINLDYMFSHADPKGIERLLVIQGDRIRRFADTEDEPRTYNDPHSLPRCKTHRMFLPAAEYSEAQKVGVMAMVQPFFILSKLKGTIRLTVWGRTEDNLEDTVATRDIVAGQRFATSGAWGEFNWGDPRWGEHPPKVLEQTGNTFDDILYVPMDVENDIVQWFGFTIEGITPDADFRFHEFVYTYQYAGPTDFDQGLDDA